ncbi:MAG: hypothetical protein A2148_02240 [Chloroflexi bacterium RBG_16_68_14]|nr:MAG: hypothetical protein A2148_02240 [Chloroflexi bacterium RBG_16_68_14]
MVEAGVSYFSSRDLRHAREDLEEMVTHGCTYAVHCFTETDLLYYRGAMQEVLRATRDAGLEAWLDPWGVTGIFSGESLSRFLVDHPEALQQRSDGRPAPAACPNHPEPRRFLLDWVAAAAEAGGQVAFWDEPHFDIPLWRGDRSGVWACRCGHCQERFRDFAGGPLPERMDDQVRAFRERSLIDLLAELSAAARRQGMRNALCLLPVDLEGVGLVELARRVEERWRKWAQEAGGTPADDEPWRSVGIRDWDAAAAIPDLDILGCDPYWYFYRTEPEPFVRAFTRRTAETARRHGRDVQIWVQAFSVPEGREEELALGLRVAAEEGATHLAAWSYRATESMSSIRCARPEVAWRVLGETFRELRGMEDLPS